MNNKKNKIEPYYCSITDGNAEHRAVYGQTKFGMGFFSEKMILFHHLDSVIKKLKRTDIEMDEKEDMINHLKEVRAMISERIL